ncbi:MAG: DUF2508 family protein [Tepidanaerobacteraceae bacterium]|jgi:hypothetical protein|nr:DUF2508 family protein [Tepidanaerobacter sp.]HQA61063.1 DUF2508 family protein [Tepidanaerobacteraceae bacterium]HQE06602.1 DUF2508 family protein [Tepidanaerobacteraceae bacterium]
MKKHDILRLLSEISSRLLFDNNGDENIDTPEMRLAEQIREAQQEWVRAQKYFQWVSDPELVDHAIFAEEAARRKYIYLLNQAKNQGISTDELK